MRCNEEPLIRVRTLEPWTDWRFLEWKPPLVVLVPRSIYGDLRRNMKRTGRRYIERVLAPATTRNGRRVLVEVTCGGRPRYPSPLIDPEVARAQAVQRLEQERMLALVERRAPRPACQCLGK